MSPQITIVGSVLTVNREYTKVMQISAAKLSAFRILLAINRTNIAFNGSANGISAKRLVIN